MRLIINPDTVGKMRAVRNAQFLQFLVHQFHKGLVGTRHIEGKPQRRVTAGVHRRPVKQISDRHLFPVQKTHGTAVVHIGIIRNLQRHLKGIVKLLLRDVFRRHQYRQNLRHGGWHDSLSGSLYRNDLIRALVHQNGVCADDLLRGNGHCILRLLKAADGKLLFHFRFLCLSFPRFLFDYAFLDFFYFQPVRLFHRFHRLILRAFFLRFFAVLYGCSDQDRDHTNYNKKQNTLHHLPPPHATLSLAPHTLPSLIAEAVLPFFSFLFRNQLFLTLVKIRFCHYSSKTEKV